LLIDDRPTPVERRQASGDEAGTAPEDRRFRPDVQGLRAVAVTLVLLFHARVPGMSGGYVGVDVFFVISGFVITGVLLRERTSRATTSIPRFYARRVRRILPAATLVIVVAVVASYVVLGPLGGAQTAGDARWASFFLINVHFASTGTNYLASQLPPSVLQNFWSLAVEEQFYLVYPTIFLVVAALSIRLSLRRRLAVVLGAAVLGSFVLSVVQTSSNQTAAYFSTLPRVWELALGGLVAVATTSLRRVPASLAAALSWGGLGLILVAAVSFSSSTPYPGSAVALPVLGAALVIAGGVAQPRYGAEFVLGLRPCQWVGLISYSLYLWHWPVLTIAAEHRASGSLSVWNALGWEFVSAVLAVLTYRLLENPIRHNRYLLSRPWASLALGGCLIVSSFAVATVELHAHPSEALATPGLAGLTTDAGCPSPTQQELRSLEGPDHRASHRIVARILVVGDSTVCTMLPGLEAVAAPAGVAIEDGTVLGCGVVSGEVAPEIDGEVVFPTTEETTRLCQQRAVAAEEHALHSGPPNVVVWGSVFERSPLVVGSGSHKRVVDPGSQQWYTVLTQRMDARLRQFTAMGATVVLLTEPPFVNLGTSSGPTPRDASFERLNAFLTRIASQTPHVRTVDLATRVCPSGPPCPILVNNVWVRGDGAHYTTEGSLWVARWLMPQLGIKGP
jgi:peptidoglycan/LPS O-acetylase OafA/YrhL